MSHDPTTDKPEDEAAAVETGQRFLTAWAEKGFHSEIEVVSDDGPAAELEPEGRTIIWKLPTQ